MIIHNSINNFWGLPLNCSDVIVEFFGGLLNF